MIELRATGLKGLQKAIEEAGDLPNEVKRNMVDEQAKVTEKALVYNAGTMLQGPYYEGEVARSIKRQKPRITKSGATEMIKFEGMQHGNRNAEVAFVNEYGKKSQPARPFIKTALRESNDPAADAAHGVLDKYLKDKGL